MNGKTSMAAVILACLCSGGRSAQPPVSIINIGNIRQTDIDAFDCSRAGLNQELSLISFSDSAVIPRNYLYPIFEWTRPRNYQGVFILRLQSAAAELLVAVRDNFWQPDAGQFNPFLTAKEVVATVFAFVKGKTCASLPVHILIAGTSVPEQIVYRVVQPLFNPVLPNSIKVFSFDRRVPSGVVEFTGGSCAGCHAYSTDAAYFNIKNLDDRRLFLAVRQGQEFHYDWKKPGEFTFFSCSPDGRYTLVTMNAYGFFVNKPTINEPFDYPYMRGDIYWYDNQKQTLNPLPGASDPAYIEDMPSFSPDGRQVIFSRYQADVAKTKPPSATIPSMDLFKVEFNQGRGGPPVPVRNASFNHHYHYFARYSPDGKWISFCRGDGSKGIFARTSSDIYLLSADELHLRKLNLNLEKTMDSWHSWSADSHWLIFSSNRGPGHLTALYLVYIDDSGRDRPPVRLISYPDMKVNTPQFISPELKLERIGDVDGYIGKTYKEKGMIK
jgi:hypothetical protein